MDDELKFNVSADDLDDAEELVQSMRRWINMTIKTKNLSDVISCMMFMSGYLFEATLGNEIPHEQLLRDIFANGRDYARRVGK